MTSYQPDLSRNSHDPSQRGHSSSEEGNLGGNVHLFVPVSWHVFGYSLLFIIVSLAAVLLFGTYTRAETVLGELGVNSVRVAPSRPGILNNVMTYEGAHVTAGSPLAEVRVEEVVAGDQTGPGQVLTALDVQERELRSQQAASNSAAGSTRAKLLAQAQGQRAALAALDRQIEQQNKLIKSAVDDLAKIQSVADRGFISRRDMAAREDSVTMRRQQLAALQQTQADKAADLIATGKAIEETGNQNRVSRAEIAGSRAVIERQRYEVAASRGYILVAPLTGRVTALTARAGQPVAPDQPLMVVVPSGARVHATLYVPTRAAGFLAVGQEVRLQVDAFPFATFGAVPARIIAISPITIDRAGPDGRSEPVYMATCSLSRTGMSAFGRYQRLNPGMTLKARLIIRKSSLLEWLFEPVFAVQRQ